MPLTEKQKYQRERTFRAILADVKVRNEAGDLILDFTPQGRDALDFASVSRTELHVLMVMAFEAGMKAK